MTELAAPPGELFAAMDARHDALLELPDGSWGELLDAPPIEESDGVEELRQLAQAIATQLIVDKVWAGRADAVRVRTACPACSRRQVVGIPFLQHACESCGTDWEPRRCRTCTRTRVCARFDEPSVFAETLGQHCRCGGDLDAVRLIPLQRRSADDLASGLPGAAAATGSGERLEAVAARHTRSWIGAGAGLAALVVAGVLLTLPGGAQAAPAPAPAAAPVHAAAGSPAALGAAARQQLVRSGRGATTLTCQQAYGATARASGGTRVDAAFLRACLGG